MGERARSNHEPGMLGGFFPAVEPGGIYIALELFAGLDGLTVIKPDAGAIVTAIAGGEYAKAAIGAVPLQIRESAGRDADGAPQGAKTV